MSESDGRGRHHRRQRALRDGGLHGRARRSRWRRRSARPRTASMVGTLEGRPVAFLPRHGARPPHPAQRAELPGQRLRPEDAGRRAHPLRLRRGLAEGEVRAAAHGDPRPVRGPHHPARLDLLRPRAGRPRGLRASRSARTCRGLLADGLRATAGATHPRGRHLRLHRGPAVLHPRGVRALPRRGAWTSSA